MDIPFDSETTSTTDADSGVVAPAAPSAPRSDWIREAVLLRRYDRPQGREQNSPARVPDWIASPAPAYCPRSQRRSNPSVAAARLWHEAWAERDWEAADEFFRTADVEEHIPHDIVRQMDPTSFP